MTNNAVLYGTNEQQTIDNVLHHGAKCICIAEADLLQLHLAGLS